MLLSYYAPADVRAIEMHNVLMVAFQFPPFAGSSAVQRTLRFVRYLPQFGWTPLVLTANEAAYPRRSDDLLHEIPAGTVVARAFSLDTARHLGVRRRYPGVLARPDRWISWLPAAVWAGLRLVRAHRPSVLWSTFPIPTAHLIAQAIHRMTGIPWVADFRDPMVQPNDPDDPRLWQAYAKVERGTLARSCLNVFTTEATRALYAARYPHVAPERLAVVENGYDEEAFAALPPARRTAAAGRPLLLLHSGAIYPLERDPSAFFAALRALRAAGHVSAERLRVRFRATGHDRAIQALVDAHDVGDLVEIAPPVAYRDAIVEMTEADGLVVLQAAQVASQVPAKVYEYLRAGRPVLGLTHSDSETARVLRRAHVTHLAAIDDAEAIAAVLLDFVRAVAADTAPLPARDEVDRSSRRHRTEELARLFDRVAGDARLQPA